MLISRQYGTFGRKNNLNDKIPAALLDLLVLMGCLTLGYYLVRALARASSYFSRRCWLGEEQMVDESLSEVAGKASRVAWLLKEDVEIEVPSDRLQVGEVVVVYPGELVPADGTVTEGMGLIDQRFLTGNSFAVIKEVGEKVFTGNIVRAGRIAVQVERVHDTTYAAQVGSILKQASQDKTNRIAPIEMATFLKEGMRNGILIRDRRALEQLSEVNTVVIDHQVALQPESAATISQLRERYVESIYLFAHDTRQQRTVRQSVTRDLNIDHCFSQRSAEDKADVIAELRADGAVVCYISDKCEPIIQKEANVSICRLLTSAPGQIDIPSADIILMDGTLNRLVPLFEMAQNWLTVKKHSSPAWVQTLCSIISACLLL